MLSADVVAVTLFHDIDQTLKKQITSACNHMPEDMHSLRNVLAAALNMETSRQTGVEFDDEEHGADPIMGVPDLCVALKGAIQCTWLQGISEPMRNKWKQLTVLIVNAIEEDHAVDQQQRNAELN